MVELNALEYLQGALTLAFVLISLVLGLIIISKYIKYKNLQLLLVGLTWIFLVSPYWPDAISFVMIITTGNEINEAVYFFVANGFIAPLHVTWGVVFSDFLYRSKKKLLVAIFAIEAIIFELVLIGIFIIDYTLIGTKLAPFIVNWADFIIFYLLASILLFLITGILFVKESLKTEDKEIKLKGKFLLVAFITFAIGTTFDVLFAESPTSFSILLARIFVIIAAFAFYIGFTLPKFIKGVFIK